MKIILATWNTTKFKWLSKGFSKTNLPITSVNRDRIDDVEETGKTCQENALIKVNAIGPIPNTIIVGEDSGLFIDALNGFPGVKTVRWMNGTDDDRSIKILELMNDKAEDNREANFTSAIALMFPDGSSKIFTGTLPGTISTQLIGEAGQGYQRIFLLKNGNSISTSGSSIVQENDHRYQAMEKAIKFINSTL